MDDVLLFLLKRGAGSEPVRVTTIEVGSALGMTQQNASRRISILRKKGIIIRKNDRIALTEKALAELRKLYSSLRLAFEGVDKLNGKIVDGVGDGKYYLSLPGYKKGIRDIFDFTPYPGTLNIKLKENDVWKKTTLFGSAVPIPNFRHKNRIFGELLARKCMINNVPAAVVLPKRTHHPEDILEIVADKNLRKALRKKTGDDVVIRI